MTATQLGPRICIYIATDGHDERLSQLKMLSEEDLEYISRRPSYVNDIESMIRFGSYEIHKPCLRPRSQVDLSSLGSLGVLPLKLLHEILHGLDVRSLTRFAPCSYLAREAVESLPSYRLIKRHTPHTLVALGYTKTMKLHTLRALRTALESAECDTCGEFGAYLFLLTYKRYCYACLTLNPSLRVIPAARAQKFLKLTVKQVKTLPTLCSIPGEYWLCSSLNYRHCRRSYRMISLRILKKLALELYGQIPECFVTDSIFQSYAHLFANISLDGTKQDPLKLPYSLHNLHTHQSYPDEYEEMVSTAFPSVSRGKVVENGLWCAGCSQLTDKIRYYTGSLEFQMQHFARSRSDFEEHVQNYPPAQDLLGERH